MTKETLTLKRLILYFLVFVIFIIAYASVLRAWTLKQTNGETDFWFGYGCHRLGPGVCDGAHEHIKREVK